MGSLTCVMYHYVAPQSSRFHKNFNFLSVKNFISQLNFFHKNYVIITPQEVKVLIKKKKINKNYIWLTFDDGYSDHVSYVLPELKKKNIKASFFPVVNSLEKKKVIPANLIHLILSKIKNNDKFFQEIIKILIEKKVSGKFLKNLKYKKNISRFDNNIIYKIKQLLQKDLSKKIREDILDYLFKKYVKSSISNILDKLYFDINEAKEIIADGHEIGMHTANHPWMETLNFEAQQKEIKKNINFFKQNRIFYDDITFCYPYGSYNKSTIKILQENSIKFGITTKPKKFYNSMSSLEIPRFDTNDFSV